MKRTERCAAQAVPELTNTAMVRLPAVTLAALKAHDQDLLSATTSTMRPAAALVIWAESTK